MNVNNSLVKKILIGVVGIAVVFIGAFFLAIKVDLITGKAIISWQPNKETDIAGYKIYYGTQPRKGDTPSESAYTDMVDTKLEHTYRFDKLSIFKTYYFSTTAYNKAGKESGLSEEVSKKIGVRDIFKK